MENIVYIRMNLYIYIMHLYLSLIYLYLFELFMSWYVNITYIYGDAHFYFLPLLLYFYFL